MLQKLTEVISLSGLPIFLKIIFKNTTMFLFNARYQYLFIYKTELNSSSVLIEDNLLTSLKYCNYLVSFGHSSIMTVFVIVEGKSWLLVLNISKLRVGEVIILQA